MNASPHDQRIIVIGAGIVGLATAWTLCQRRPEATITVLEKESGPARHQTGRNSGVIHSGVYYPPESLKASLCCRGKSLLEAFCTEHGVAFETCGKVIVATTDAEVTRLDAIEQRGVANGVTCHRLDREALAEIEPCATGVSALHVPGAGIIDYTAVADKLVELLEDRGAAVTFDCTVVSLAQEGNTAHVRTQAGNREADQVVVCAGLWSDRLLQASGVTPTVRIVPFRGEYFLLREDVRDRCRHLIYPVPDPQFPFLGVHLTRGMDGEVEVGPNAVPALARDGYDWGRIDVGDLINAATWPGTWRLFGRHLKMGLGEIHRSWSRAAFAKALSKLVPGIKAEHLIPAPAGVRAQALSRDGSLVDDFLMHQEGSITHILNAPSPAATASLAIAEHITDRVIGKATS